VIVPKKAWTWGVNLRLGWGGSNVDLLSIGKIGAGNALTTGMVVGTIALVNSVASLVDTFVVCVTVRPPVPRKLVNFAGVASVLVILVLAPSLTNSPAPLNILSVCVPL